jgi:hypothetical protein
MTKLVDLYKKYLGKGANPMPAAIMIGCFIPLIAWIIEIIVQKTPVSFSGIVTIHRESPSLLVVDLYLWF